MDQNNKNGSQWTTMDQNGSEWVKLTQWIKIDKNESLRCLRD